MKTNSKLKEIENKTFDAGKIVLNIFNKDNSNMSSLRESLKCFNTCMKSIKLQKTLENK